MELGKGKLLRTGLNSLFQAIHPVHGLAWTDGRQVMLTALHLHNEDPKFGDSTVIGQFERVHGLYWGPAGSADTPSLLAVQHKKHVTVWQLYYNILENIKLMVTQACEIGEPFPVLPQGCVWHPKNDVLAVLTKRDVSVFYNVRYDNSSIKADIKCSGLIHCACWTKGNRLVVASGTALHSYIWDKAQKTLNPCSFCPIFDVGNYVCAIESVGGSQVAIATELPLDKICSLNEGSAFDIPAGTESSSFLLQPNLMKEENSLEAGNEEPRNIDGVTDSSGPVDLTHILANSEQSDSNTLFHLIRKDLLMGSGQDSSHLILVTLEQKVTSTRKVSIPGILVPDILAFDPTAHIVAVASNTYSTILVYSLSSSSIPIQQIHLEKNERPKGLCFLTKKKLLILVGKQKYCDPAFPPSSCSEKYIIRLLVKEVMCEEDSSASSRCQNAVFGFDSCMRTAGHRVHFENCSRDDQFMNQVLSEPGDTLFPSGRGQLIEQVHYEQSLTSNNLGEKSLAFGMETDNEPKTQTVNELDVMSETSNVCNNNNLPANKETCQASSNQETLFSRIADLEQHLPEITDSVQNEEKLSAAYPSSLDPPFVYIRFQKTPFSGITVFEDKRSVLLCDGKLRLNVVQELFRIRMVEMQHGSSWIVLTTDSEGFVPLTFKTKQEIIIREPKARLQD